MQLVMQLVMQRREWSARQRKWLDCIAKTLVVCPWKKWGFVQRFFQKGDEHADSARRCMSTLGE